MKKKNSNMSFARDRRMNYNWEGDCIIHECSIDNKRFVLKSKKSITTDIREFVSPQDDVIIKDIIKKLVKEKNLPTSKDPGDFDKRAMIVWDYVARNIKYDHDCKIQRKGDFWLFPSEVHILQVGDCEDSSFLLASLLIGSGISPFNVRVVLGELIDKKGKPLGGHCWVTYKNEAGRWCILESIFDKAPSPWSMPFADMMTDGGDVNYLPYYCFNNYHLWTIYHDSTANYSDLKTYLNERKGMPDLKDTRLPSGKGGGLLGWAYSIIDNSPGHYDITTEILKSFIFSKDAVSVASDAAQDPDFYEWSNPRAHAQTDNDSQGRTNETSDAAKSQYINWVKLIINKFFSSTLPSYKLFYLGYVLHGIQDLAAHQGVTNAQHSYESYIYPGIDKDCDHLPENRDVAKTYTTRFLEQLEKRDSVVFNKFKTYSGDSTVSYIYKCKLLNKRNWDLTPSAYREYKGLAPKYDKIKSSYPRITWERDEVFREILNLI